MTSLAQAAQPLLAVRGLIFFGFPLHPPGKPGDARGEHLHSVQLPMLFLQGTRDQFADLTFLRPLSERLGARATLELLPGADHSFHVRAMSGGETKIESVLADAAARWIDQIAAAGGGTASAP